MQRALTQISLHSHAVWSGPMLFANEMLNPSPAEPRYVLPLQTALRSRSVEEANWPGSALFAIKYVNLYQQSGPSDRIGWKLEMAVAS